MRFIVHLVFCFRVFPFYTHDINQARLLACVMWEFPLTARWCKTLRKVSNARNHTFILPLSHYIVVAQPIIPSPAPTFFFIFLFFIFQLHISHSEILNPLERTSVNSWTTQGKKKKGNGRGNYVVCVYFCATCTSLWQMVCHAATNPGCRRKGWKVQNKIGHWGL